MNDSFTRRLSPLQLVLGSFLVGFICIAARLIHLQIISQTALLYRSKRNYLRCKQIPSPRGSIYDRNGILLATNRPIVRLVWQGSGNRQLSDTQQQDLIHLGSLLGTSWDETDIKSTESRRQSSMLLDDISFDQLSIILEQFPDHTNIMLETHFQRYYPHQHLAAHILGYISDITNNQTGVMGLEKACNATLCGIHGQVLTTINSYGQSLSQQEVLQARNGGDIHTTLDITLQQCAEQAFPEGSAGTFIVMEATTGALRAVLSRPSFDPNIFLSSISIDEWTGLTKASTFLNRAFCAAYPPASLFKLVTITAALDTHLISQYESWYCPGYSLFHGRQYGCMHRKQHGFVAIDESLSKSCNIPFFEIAKSIKINTLAHYAHMLGLGISTHNVIGEKSGLIPTTQWKQSTFHEPWWPGETLSVAIGQSFTLVTPIQMCRMMGTVCQGYTVMPHLIDNRQIEKVVPPINPQVFALLRQALKGTANTGTGQILRSLHHMNIYAKTGTAQTCALKEDPTTGETDPATRAHGWFAAQVTYKDQPPLILVILLEHAGSSKVTTRVAKDFLMRYKRQVDAME